MKKYFVFLGIAALTLAACSKTEIDETAIPDQKIEFNAANYVPQTRAAGDTVSILSETNTFKTKAYLHAEGMPTVQDYFGANGETITYHAGASEADESVWVPSHDYYWPKSKKSYINFVSWYDGNANRTPAVTETTIKWENAIIGTKDNIMWADEAWHYNSNAQTYKFDGVREGVPTLFHHALAKLTIKAKCDPVEKNDSQVSGTKTTWDVTLTDIKITGTYNQGSLTLTNEEPTGTSPAQQAYTTNGWVLPTTGTAPGITMDSTNVLTTSLVDVLAEQSVLPQTLDNAILEFTLHIITKYNGKQYSEEKIHKSVKLNTLGTPAIAKWEMNTKYVYNIIINPETDVVKFDPAVIPWVVDANAPTYNVPAGQINS